MNKVILAILATIVPGSFSNAMEVKEKVDLKTRLEQAMDTARPGSALTSKAIKDAIESGNVNVEFTKANLIPLHLAVWKGTVDDVKALLNQGARVSAKSSQGYTPLHFALLSLYRPDQGDLKEIIGLILAGRAEALLRAVDNQGNTPLHLVRFKEQYPSVMRDPRLLKLYNDIDEFLVKQGAREDVQNIHGQTPAEMKYRPTTTQQPIRRIYPRSERVISEPMTPPLYTKETIRWIDVPITIDAPIILPPKKEKLP